MPMLSTILLIIWAVMLIFNHTEIFPWWIFIILYPLEVIVYILILFGIVWVAD